MREKMVYICDTCGMVYPTRESCMICENKHRKDCWIDSKFYPESDAYPLEIKLGFGNYKGHADKIIAYRRFNMEDDVHD